MYTDELSSNNMTEATSHRYGTRTEWKPDQVPIQTQPHALVMSPHSSPQYGNIPPWMAYLGQLDRVQAELVGNRVTQRNFDISDRTDKKFLTCKWRYESTFCPGTYHLEFADMDGAAAMNTDISPGCSGFNDLSVMLPGDQCIAKLVSNYGMCKHQVDILDPQQRHIFRMDNPSFSGGHFVITQPDGGDVAEFRIPGLSMTRYVFNLNFITNLPPVHKAILLGSAFFIIDLIMNS